jgi:hypothetical protein
MWPWHLVENPKKKEFTAEIAERRRETGGFLSTFLSAHSAFSAVRLFS